MKISTTSNELIEVKEGQILYRSDCFTSFSAELVNTYYRKGILYASLHVNDEHTVVAKDVVNCEDFIIFEGLVGDDFKFLDNKVLDTRYLLFSSEGRYSEEGVHYIVDIETKSYNQLEATSHILNPYESFVEDETFYIMGRDEGHFQENPGYIYIVDLANLSDRPVPFNEIYSTENIIFSEKCEDQKFYLSWGLSYGKTFLGQYHIPEDHTELINDKLAEQNRGVMRVSHGLEASGRYYYMDDFGVYTLANDKVELLIEGNAHMPMVERDGSVFGVVGSQGRSFLFEINTTNNSWDTVRFDGNGSIDQNSAVTPYAVIHPRNHPHGGGMIDLETKEFIAFRELLGGSNYRIFGLSGENVFIEVSAASSTTYIILNTRTKEFSNVEKVGHRFSRSPSDGQNGFYLLEGIYDPPGDRKVVHVDGLGNVLEEYVTRYRKPFTKRYYVEDEDFVMVPLPGEEEVHVFMAKNNEAKIKSVPFQNVDPITKLLIRNDGDYIVMVNELEGVQRVTQLNFDEDAIQLTELNASEEVLEIVLSNEKIALFIHERLEDVARIDILDRTTKELLSSEHYEMSKEIDSQLTHLGDLNDTLSLFNFNDRKHGEEVYLFNINNGSFDLLADIAPGHLDGSLDDFVSMNGFIYFTSLTEDRSRQWFRFKISDHLNLRPVDESVPMNIFPNPSADFISFDYSMSEYEVFNASGASCLRSNDFNGYKVDVTILTSGYYVIKAKLESGEQVYGSFIVQR